MPSFDKMYWNFNYSSLMHSTTFSLVANSVAIYDKLEQSLKEMHYKSGITHRIVVLWGIHTALRLREWMLLDTTRRCESAGIVVSLFPGTLASRVQVVWILFPKGSNRSPWRKSYFSEDRCLQNELLFWLSFRTKWNGWNFITILWWQTVCCSLSELPKWRLYGRK